MQRRDGVDREIEFVELVGEVVVRAFVAFVGGEKHGKVAFAQAARHFAVERLDTEGGVDDKNQRGGILQGGLDLGENAGLDHIGRALVVEQADATGVDQFKAFVAISNLHGEAVAGDPGAFVDDGHAAADHPVEQGRLADVGTTDNGDHAAAFGLVFELSNLWVVFHCRTPVGFRRPCTAIPNRW